MTPLTQDQKNLLIARGILKAELRVSGTFPSINVATIRGRLDSKTNSAVTNKDIRNFIIPLVKELVG